MKNRVKILMVVILLSIIGTVSGVTLIDNYIENCIAKMQTEVVVNVYNNTASQVNIKQNGNNIDVYVDDIDKENNNGTDIKEHIESKIPDKVKITSESGLNIRMGPSLESDKVGAINYGDVVEVLDVVGDWYYIGSGEFIFKEYTTIYQIE